LPWFTPALPDGRRPDISLRQLMTHTSGLSYPFFEPEGNAYQALGIELGLEHSKRTLEENLRRLAEAPLFYEPGREWRYSLSIDVLGGVIEKASGLSLPAAVERYVTGPLGMRDTVFGVADAGRLVEEPLRVPVSEYGAAGQRLDRLRPRAVVTPGDCGRRSGKRCPQFWT